LTDAEKLRREKLVSWDLHGGCEVKGGGSPWSNNKSRDHNHQGDIRVGGPVHVGLRFCRGRTGLNLRPLARVGGCSTNTTLVEYWLFQFKISPNPKTHPQKVGKVTCRVEERGKSAVRGLGRVSNAMEDERNKSCLSKVVEQTGRATWNGGGNGFDLELWNRKGTGGRASTETKGERGELTEGRAPGEEEKEKPVGSLSKRDEWEKRRPEEKGRTRGVPPRTVLKGASKIPKSQIRGGGQGKGNRTIQEGIRPGGLVLELKKDQRSRAETNQSRDEGKWKRGKRWKG